MRSWVEGADGSRVRGGAPAVRRGPARAAGSRELGVRIGRARARPGRLRTRACSTAWCRTAVRRLGNGTLNALLALGRPQWTRSAHGCTELLTDDAAPPTVRAAAGAAGRGDDVAAPGRVADYVDFYSSEHHATNVGRIFRPGQRRAAAQLEAPADRLPRPRRHGRRLRHRRSSARAGSAGAAEGPISGPSRRLDIEAEVGFVVGVPTALGRRVSADDFADHVFGVVLVNDWSARDIQAWEYQPLGPFLGKSFATSVSAWVMPLDALARRASSRRRRTRRRCPTCATTPTRGARPRLSRSSGTASARRREPPPFASMYWTPGPAARPPDRQRRRRCAPATCSPPAPSPAPRATSSARSSS